MLFVTNTIMLQEDAATSTNEATKEYSEEELSQTTLVAGNESSYFERAQDFSDFIRALRINYLCLKPITKSDGKNTYTIWVKDKNKHIGINEMGVDANIRFLEQRLTKHVVFTNWDERRMFTVIMDDMNTWADMMEQNEELYELSIATQDELRILINDVLEYSYRRAIGNKEREGMVPMAKEILRRLGLDRNEEQQFSQYPSSIADKMKKELNY